MSKTCIRFLGYTFSIMVVCWGICLGFSLSGTGLSKLPVLYVPFMLGLWSPTIASFVLLKQLGKIRGVRDWLRKMFDVRQSIRAYLMVALFVTLFFVPHFFINGFELEMPLYSLVLMIPVMIFGGGLEEEGWRHILQPELEKKFSYVVTTLMVSVVWWFWHLPMFYIEGASKHQENHWLFGINVLGLSFALAAIRRCTKSVWLCMLFHSLINSILATFYFKDHLIGNVISMALLIVASCLCVVYYQRKVELPEESGSVEEP